MTLGKIKLLIHLLWLAILISCAGSTSINQAVPAPLAELPSNTINFPESVAEIGVNRLSSTSSELNAAIVIGADISGTIQNVVLSTLSAYGLVDDILGPLSTLEIPISLSDHFEGIIISENNLINVKIDFSDYGGRGCSGHTAALPICYRIWYDGQRVLFGQFDTFPTREVPGAGDLTGIGFSDILINSGLQVSVKYDFVLPLVKKVDLAFYLQNFEEPEFSSLSRVQLDQVPSDDSLLKTFSSSRRSDFSGLEQLNGRWIDAEDYFSTSRNSEYSDPYFNFEAACAYIPTGIVVERGICLGLGIDVGGLGFAPLPDPSEFAFPPDFPVNPTF